MSPNSVIVDDDPAFRAAARVLLALRGFNVVAEAGSVAAGVAVVGELAPQVVLLDFHLPDGSGLQAAARIRFRCPNARVLLTSAGELRPSPEQLEAAGVRTFVAKEDLAAVDFSKLLSL